MALVRGEKEGWGVGKGRGAAQRGLLDRVDGMFVPQTRVSDFISALA